MVLALAWLVSLGVPAYAGWQVWHGLSLERAVADTTRMDAAALDAAMRESPWRTNRFFIGAIVQNKFASAALLDYLASLPQKLPDTDLFEPLGSLWDVKLDNRKGFSAMRLVVRNPNVGAMTLARLADGPRSDAAISDILANPKTPLTVLQRYFDSTDVLIEWGLALNPNLPVAVMERLSESKYLYTRFNLTYNAATPRVILEKLARDSDPTLATHAEQAIERQVSRKQRAPEHSQ